MCHVRFSLKKKKRDSHPWILFLSWSGIYANGHEPSEELKGCYCWSQTQTVMSRSLTWPSQAPLTYFPRLQAFLVCAREPSATKFDFLLKHKRAIPAIITEYSPGSTCEWFFVPLAHSLLWLPSFSPASLGFGAFCCYWKWLIKEYVVRQQRRSSPGHISMTSVTIQA